MLLRLYTFCTLCSLIMYFTFFNHYCYYPPCRFLLLYTEHFKDFKNILTFDIVFTKFCLIKIYFLKICHLILSLKKKILWVLGGRVIKVVIHLLLIMLSVNTEVAGLGLTAGRIHLIPVLINKDCQFFYCMSVSFFWYSSFFVH